MGTASQLRQMLGRLCHDMQWEYAVFWKLKHRSSMLLTWEDGYCVSPEPSVSVYNASQSGFLNEELGIISSACEMDAQSGTSAECPIKLAVANMSCHVYSLGEGIVGKVALSGKHRWVFTSDFNSKLLPECPKEWHLQLAAGIKTILLVPIVPQGVVQLGSLEMVRVIEDSKMVAHIRDLFSNIQHDGTSTPFTSNRVLFNPSGSTSSPLIRNFSAVAAVTGNLRTHPPSKLFMKKELVAPQIKQITKNREPNAISHLSPLSMVPDDISPTENNMQHTLGIDIGLCVDESSWKMICNAISGVATEESCILNQSLCSNLSKMIEGDMSSFAPDYETCAPSQCDAKQFAMLDPRKKDLQHWSDSYCYARETVGQPFGKGTFNSELHKALGPAFLQGRDDCVWDTWLSEEDGLRSPTVAWQMEKAEAYDSPLAESNQWFMKERDVEHLLDAVVSDLYASDDSISKPSRSISPQSTSSENLTSYCLTQNKYESDASGVENSAQGSHLKSALLSRSDVFASSPTTSLAKSVSMLIDEEKQNKGLGYEQLKRSSRTSYAGKRKANTDEVRRQRPRDRQLIQDRVKELRELVPNGAKCSIDALLDRTIMHMLFLRSVSSQSEKLKQCTQAKASGEGQKSGGAQVYQNGASWACEIGNQSEVCPIIVENLGQPGHMLVEILCKEYGLFLEIAQVIRHLELTILKGVMETRSDELWAHFIVEASRGFHRMDILWPLMQLLQRNWNPIASKF